MSKADTRKRTLDAAYQAIQRAAIEADATEGDPRWYGINIALRAIIDLRDGRQKEKE